jgi:hypothetical protein
MMVNWAGRGRNRGLLFGKRVIVEKGVRAIHRSKQSRVVLIIMLCDAIFIEGGPEDRGGHLARETGFLGVS